MFKFDFKFDEKKFRKEVEKATEKKPPNTTATSCVELFVRFTARHRP